MPSVSEPATVAEAGELLRHASAEGLRVSIDRAGGNIVLSTHGLTRLVEHEPGDLTCIVEAGIRLSELQERLRPHGQMLMLDPPGDPTIGACVAANLSGPRRHRYGSPRDLVLGVTVVLADGTVASSGGKVVKNVAGYDLGKLFCGSRGFFGLIARVALRLHPIAVSRATLSVPVADADNAQRYAQLVLRSQLVPSALDLLWPGKLAVLLEGGERAVRAQLDAARGLFGAGDEDDSVWDDVAARQLASNGRAWFDPGRLADALRPHAEAVVRVAAGRAYLPTAWAPSSLGGPIDDERGPERALRARIRSELDPQEVLLVP